MFLPNCLAAIRDRDDHRAVLRTVDGILASTLLMCSELIDQNNKIAILTTHTLLVQDIVARFKLQQGKEDQRVNGTLLAHIGTKLR